MSKKLLMVVLIGLFAATLLAGCDRPASTAPAATPPGGDIPFPVQQPTTSLGVLATQTAAAKNPAATQAPAAGNPTAAAKPTGAAPQATGAAPQPTAAGAATQSPVATATTKPQIVVPTATPGRPATYTVQSGDHYLCIARRYNLNPDEFMTLNGLSMNSQAMVGATVKIPQSGSWPSSFGARSLKAHPDTYTVLSGDTIYKIACIYGDVDPNAVVAANALAAPFTLTAGQILHIP